MVVSYILLPCGAICATSIARDAQDRASLSKTFVGVRRRDGPRSQMTLKMLSRPQPWRSQVQILPPQPLLL